MISCCGISAPFITLKKGDTLANGGLMFMLEVLAPGPAPTAAEYGGGLLISNGELCGLSSVFLKLNERAPRVMLRRLGGPKSMIGGLRNI